MANVAKLLHTEVDPETFLVNLSPKDSVLRDARRKIREHLRKAFAAAGREHFGRVVQPRFFTQGSFAYKTLNEPAWPPKQQMDLDDGCYLPLSFVRGARPSQAAAMFFAFVDAALKELAKTEGWRHVEKPTCCRLVIGDDAHVDVPLYAIPDDEFLQLAAKVESLHAAAKRKIDDWADLPSDAVLLAHREEDWIESDPRLIHAWFTDAVEKVFGERLRRDCRYMKGWRDYHELDRYGVTSILLMATVWYAYEVIRGPFLPDREDERLLAVVKQLPRYLRSSVPNPACKSEDLNRIPEEHRETVAKKVEELASRLEDVVKDCRDAREAVAAMTKLYGPRMPDRPDLVTVAVSVVGKVLAQPKKVTPAPEVGRSQSG
jgi:hypothetical protein